MDHHRYRLAGFDLACEFALPLPPCPSGMAATAPAVHVYRGEARMLSAPRAQRLLVQVASDDYFLEIPGVARYRVRHGSEIVVEVAPHAATAAVAAYLCSYALAALCCQRGLLVAHATTLACGERAVLLLGASGSGKSTLGACLALRGAQVLSDDLCIIDTRGERALAHPISQRLALWPAGAMQLGLALNEAEQPVPGVAKVLIQIGAPGATPLPVHLVLLQEARTNPTEVRAEAAGPLAALASLGAGAGLTALLEGMNRGAAHLEQCRRVLARASAWKISHPRSFDALPQMARLIEGLAAQSPIAEHSTAPSQSLRSQAPLPTTAL